MCGTAAAQASGRGTSVSRLDRCRPDRQFRNRRLRSRRRPLLRHIFCPHQRTLTLNNTQVVSNTAGWGGGVYVSHEEGEDILYDNYGSPFAVEIDASQLSDNHARTTLGNGGGGLDVQSYFYATGPITVTLSDTDASSNTAASGGGGIHFAGDGSHNSLILQNNTIRFNQTGTEASRVAREVAYIFAVTAWQSKTAPSVTTRPPALARAIRPMEVAAASMSIPSPSP